MGSQDYGISTVENLNNVFEMLCRMPNAALTESHM